MIQRDSTSTPQWLVTVGGTAVVAATTAAWMSYTQKRLVPFSWIRKRLMSSTSNKSYYLDYNGTTPIYPEVFETMKPYLTEHFGNPSSSHLFGTQPRMAIQTARKQILSDLLGSTSSDLSSIWFTGCGTESDNMAIKLALATNTTKTKHIVTCNVEHPAIENYLRQMETDQACTVTRVPVDTEGRVSANDIIDAITDDTVLVTLMLANNESGALQPVKEVAEECRKRGVLCHTDAAQAAGKVSVHLKDMGNPDMVTIVGHKIGAPKGIAALYVRPGCLDEHGRRFETNDKLCNSVLLIGGGQESGRRGGTENTPYIVALGKAAEMAQANLKKNSAHMEGLRSRLLSNLQSVLGESKVKPNGPSDPTQRLPNTLSVGLDGVRSSDLLTSVGHVVAASAGAACHSTGGSISSVLVAMKVPESFARGTLRLSVGPTTTTEDIDEASEILASAALAQWKEGTN